MKAMTKSELACEAGVSVKTLKNWCRPFSEDLARMGVNPEGQETASLRRSLSVRKIMP